MALTGEVKKWFDERGFGFIACAEADKDTFFHIKDWRAGGNKGDPSIGDKVSFDISTNGGKTFATNMKRI